MIDIQELSNDEKSVWNDYVKNHSFSTFYHLYNWHDVVKESYNHRARYLIARSEGDVVGILPMFEMRSKFFGSKMVSLPFGSYGGCLSESNEITELLINKAIELSKQQKLDYLELRNISKYDDLIENDVYVTFTLNLDSDPEITWKEKLNTKVRNATRKSIKAGLEFDIDKEYLKDFYRLFSKSMNALGTPVHSYNFFKNILKYYPDNSNIFIVKKGDKVIAALFALMYKDNLISGWEASDKSYLKLNPNNLLYWKAIEYGCNNGFKIFDFGRSINNSGTYKFKKPWGAEIKQLHYKYYLNKVNNVPDTSQENKRRKLFSKYWCKLPLSMTNKIGPILRKDLP